MKRKYRIGQFVRVDIEKRVIAHYNKHNQRVLIRYCDDYGYKPKPDIRVGVITGAKKMQTGSYKNGTYTSNNYSNYDPYYREEVYEQPYLKVEKTITLWCVKTGYLNKEKHFFDEDIVPLENGNVILQRSIDDIPWLDSGWSTEAGKKVKEMLKKDSKDWLRDKKGRFV